MFHPIHFHLHYLCIMVPVLHFPVPENQFPVNKDNFIFVKFNKEESLEYVELSDMLLNKELDSLTIMNLCFAAFKDLVPVLDLQSQIPSWAFRLTDNDDGGLEYVKVPPIFQAKALHPLSLQKASTVSHLVMSFQV